MRLDQFNNPIYSSADIKNLIYQGKIDILNKLRVDDSQDVQQFNSVENLFLVDSVITETLEEFDSKLQQNWLMPEEYKNMDIEGFLVHVCPKEHYQRLIDELVEFRARNMLNLLRWLKYFVDTCRKNDIVWGVGRGSSVSSYVLFLIGVHKIDCIKYKLDWREFLR